MPEHVNIAFDTEDPPFSSRNDMGEAQGFSIELCRDLLREWLLAHA